MTPAAGEWLLVQKLRDYVPEDTVFGTRLHVSRLQTLSGRQTKL